MACFALIAASARSEGQFPESRPSAVSGCPIGCCDGSYTQSAALAIYYRFPEADIRIGIDDGRYELIATGAALNLKGRSVLEG